MAYYYVKSGGTAVGADIDTADGIYSTQQTGTWASAFSAASEYFPDIGSAVSAAHGAPSDGDQIVCSDVHNASYDNGSGVALNSGASPDGAGLSIVSVDDDTDITAYMPGAIDKLSDVSDDFTFHQSGLVAGVSFGTGDDVLQAGTTPKWIFQDSTLGTASGPGDNIMKLNGDGARIVFNNVTCDIGNTSASLMENFAGGSVLIWNGGALTGTAPANLSSSTSFGVNGGASVYFNGVDLSIYQGALSRFANAAGGDVTLWRYNNCKLHASASLGTPVNASQRCEVFGGWGGSDQHGFAIKDWMGQAEHDDAVYVTNDEAWYEGSVISSIKIVTTANASHVNPFVIEMPAQYADLGDSGSDVLSLECVSATSGLQSNDVAAFLVYPDAASTVTPNWVTSGKTVGAGNYGIDPLSTSGNALDAGALGAGDWTGEPGSPNFHKLELDTTGDPGEATGASIRIEVYKPSLTIYISPQIRAA